MTVYLNRQSALKFSEMNSTDKEDGEGGKPTQSDGAVQTASVTGERKEQGLPADKVYLSLLFCCSIRQCRLCAKSFTDDQPSHRGAACVGCSWQMRWPATQSGASPPAARTECAAPAGDDFIRPAWSSQRQQLQVGRGPQEPRDPSTRGLSAGLQPGAAETRLFIPKVSRGPALAALSRAFRRVDDWLCRTRERKDNPAAFCSGKRSE